MNNINSRTYLQVNDSTDDGKLKSSDVAIPLVALFLLIIIAFQIYQSSSIAELAVMQKEQLSSIKDLAMMQKDLAMMQNTLSSQVNSIDIKLGSIIGGTAFLIAVFSGLNQIVSGLQSLDDFFAKRAKRIDEDENKKKKTKR